MGGIVKLLFEVLILSKVPPTRGKSDVDNIGVCARWRGALSQSNACGDSVYKTKKIPIPVPTVTVHRIGACSE